MEKLLFESFEVKNFSGNINIPKDLYNNLKLPSELIFWKKDDNEIILFSENKWNIFVEEMKKTSPYTNSQLEWTKEGRTFMRRFNQNTIKAILGIIK